MLGITDYLWRLLPGNPILLRVVAMASKRKRDWFVRMGYLALLIILVFFSLSSKESGLDALAKMSGQIFMNISYVQLALVALLSPIFTAGAITQEKDSQTYDILLATPLSNAQIVVGSLGSRLFLVLALLVSGIPIFSITQIFGGVAISSIVMSFLIAATTAIVTGSLAMAIATFKVGTRRTIFGFYVFVVIYLVGIYLLDRVPYFKIPGRNIIPGTESAISWFTGLHPFLALRVIFNDPSYTPPERLALPDHLRWGPLSWYFSSPATFFVSFMTFLSVVLVMPSILMLRFMAQSTSSVKAWLLKRILPAASDRRRKPRSVWNNPIAWREARTKASAARSTYIRWGFMIFGLAAAVGLLVMHSMEAKYSRYISPSSFSTDGGSITLFGGESPDTFLISPNTDVTLNSNRVDLNSLKGRFQVVGTPTTDVRNRRLLTSLALSEIPRRLSDVDVRRWLLGVVIVEFAVILLIVTNAAASTVTREKEDGTLDLLLTTPITSRYYIWGKLSGLVSFVLPLVAVPVASALLFVVYDTIRFAGGSDAAWIIFPEALLVMPATLVMVAAFAAITGMNLSLRCRTTVRAVMSSVGIVLALCGALGLCGFSILQGRTVSPMTLLFTSFSPFTVLTVLIDPYTAAGSIFLDGTADDISNARWVQFVFGLVSTGAYAAIVWTMYQAMVKNFDMTIRKQSR